MAEKTSGRGGAREGAGRPRELDESCKPRAIYCTWSEKQDMEKFLAFRRAIEKTDLNPFSFKFTFSEWCEFMSNTVPPLSIRHELPEDVTAELQKKIKAIRDKTGKFRVKSKKHGED
ncbi:hypothetical protein [Anaerovibrio sp.]|uniref:hypothetical protein n=1 Tax=Anaerovibrio sp. TaxID=1872532 RepID=UPI0025BDC344|nr:hypothetical protein [Anaerovibrio sp.]MBR2141720.1 hypothetical protein [Anaerovibrio sp.]